MKRAWQLVFMAAFCVSMPLVAACGLWALIFICSSIAFGILYTGGPKPLGYMGLGELFVLPYFGPIAVAGAYYVQAHQINATILWLSLSPGLLSAAILVANNLRDEETDKRASKNTLVVRFGRTFGAWEYALFVSSALLLPLFYGFYGPLFLAPFAILLIHKAFTFRNSQEGAPLLAQTAALLIAFTALFCVNSTLYIF
jgi:1,4-dihydroxy-2-naphthoate octaprenyltransferase